MIFVPIILAIVFCGALGVAAYLRLLCPEAVRLRPREAARALPSFEETLQPRLKLEAENGVQRFAAVKQCILVALTLDLAYLFGARQGLTPQRLLEVLVVT